MSIFKFHKRCIICRRVCLDGWFRLFLSKKLYCHYSCAYWLADKADETKNILKHQSGQADKGERITLNSLFEIPRRIYCFLFHQHSRWIMTIDYPAYTSHWCMKCDLHW